MNINGYTIDPILGQIAPFIEWKVEYGRNNATCVYENLTLLISSGERNKGFINLKTAVENPQIPQVVNITICEDINGQTIVQLAAAERTANRVAAMGKYTASKSNYKMAGESSVGYKI